MPSAPQCLHRFYVGNRRFKPPNPGAVYDHPRSGSPILWAVIDRPLKFIDEPRRRRARTLAGGTRAFFSAYHRKNESSESRTLKRVRGLLAPGWGAGVFSFLIPGVALAAARLTPG